MDFLQQNSMTKPMFLVCHTVLLLCIASDGWFPALNEMCRPIPNPDHLETRRLSYSDSLFTKSAFSYFWGLKACSGTTLEGPQKKRQYGRPKTVLGFDPEVVSKKDTAYLCQNRNKVQWKAQISAGHSALISCFRVRRKTNKATDTKHPNLLKRNVLADFA